MDEIYDPEMFGDEFGDNFVTKFGDESGDEFGESPKLVMNLSPYLLMNFVINQIWR